MKYRTEQSEVDPINTKHTAFGRNLLLASLLTALFILFAAELYAFARAQDIWVDESTQLSGITLTLGEMLRWLSGVDLNRFGVPGDRMPPVSYFLDWMWLRFAGPSELGFRLFHSGFVIAGAAVLAVVAFQRIGWLAATVVLAFLVLSPRLIQTGVEIRAYPIFFAVTCVQVAMFVGLVVDPKRANPKLLMSFVLACLVAVYTHFYGVVSTCVFFIVLGIAFFRSSASLVPPMLSFICVLIGSLGIIPFVTSAVSQSPPLMSSGRTFGNYFEYLLRLFGDSANMVSVPASICFLGGAVTLFLIGMIAAATRARQAKSQPLDWLFLVAIGGVLAPLVASVFVKNFNVMSANYNGWLFAPLALLIGVGAISSIGFRPWDRGGRLLVSGAVVIGAAAATYIFLVHDSMFSHGPRRFVGALYDRAAGPKAVIYEVGAKWGFSYFPLVYSYGNEIAQYRASRNGAGLIRIEDGGDISNVQMISAAVAPYRDLLVVNVQLRTFRDLRGCIESLSACRRFEPGAIENALIETGQWKLSKVKRRVGLYDTQVELLERVGRRVGE